MFAVGFVICRFERRYHFALQKPGLLCVIVVCLVLCLFGLCSAEGHTLTDSIYGCLLSTLFCILLHLRAGNNTVLLAIKFPGIDT